LAEYTDETVDVCRVMKMTIIHDIVEIDAGDTYIYDEAGNAKKAEVERQAADRIFALLPLDQCNELHTLWDEFEAGVTPESRFAKAIDRIMPLLHNYYTGGRSWREHGITADQVLARNRNIASSSIVLWDFVCGLIEEAVGSGFLPARIEG
jgi:putative hydrolase of HD superfamily